MISGLFALTLASPAVAAQPPPLELCRGAVARKVDGDVSALDLASQSRKDRTLRLRGTATALIGMAPAGPGMASAHHLIRARYKFDCRVRSGSVRSLSLKRFE